MNNIVQDPFPDPTQACQPFEAAMRLLGRRWAGAVVRAMLAGAQRFGEIREAAPGITDAVLSARLRELCEMGLARRDVTPTTPVTVRYRLTRAGRDLEPVLAAVQAYGERHRRLLDGR